MSLYASHLPQDVPLLRLSKDKEKDAEGVDEGVAMAVVGAWWRLDGLGGWPEAWTVPFPSVDMGGGGARRRSVEKGELSGAVQEGWVETWVFLAVLVVF